MKAAGVVIFSTFSSEDSARALAKKVVEGGLFACVNFVKVRSIYVWKGREEDQDEWLALFKTTRRTASVLKAEIARLHPYEVPEIVEVRMDDVSGPYLSWLAGSTHGVAKKGHHAPKR